MPASQPLQGGDGGSEPQEPRDELADLQAWGFDRCAGVGESPRGGHKGGHGKGLIKPKVSQSCARLAGMGTQ